MTRHGPGNYCRRGCGDLACSGQNPHHARAISVSLAADVSGLLLVRYEARLRSLERQVADLKDEVRRLRG